MKPMQQRTSDGLSTSILGFGCGSVLGRVGRASSLRAMGAAWDEGITLFDTARSYGYGNAESVLGKFLKGKREKAVIATKYGIAPERQGKLKLIATPVARVMLQLPGVAALRRHDGIRQIRSGEFNLAGLRASVETSLRELQTDYIDILYMHEASRESVHREDLAVELASLIQAGKLVRAGLYADSDVIAEGIMRGPATFTAMQFGADYFDPAVSKLMCQNPGNNLLVANHPFGNVGRIKRTEAALAAMSADESCSAELREKLHAGDWQMVLEAILGVILQGTEIHALVFSMMRPDHLRANSRAIDECRFSSAELAIIRKRLLAA